jgi:serine/threonine-protein kinase
MQPKALDALAQVTKRLVPLRDGARPAERSEVRVTTAAQRSRARATELVGQTIARRYRIDKLLAMGGMGAVYVAHHLLLKKKVAIKILHPDTEGLHELVVRFQREAIAGAHIVHPHVAAATDFGQLADGSYFLVLEYVAGETLHDLLWRGRVPAARAVHLARQIAAALGAAHAMGVVHRDVKPANIMLVEGQDDVVKLIDFGFAKVPVDEVVGPLSAREQAQLDGPRSGRVTLDALDPGGDLTAVGVVFGTVEYMAPETSLGMRAVGPRADLYALGVILYELLAGRHPFEETEPAQLFAQHRFSPPPPFAVVAPGVEVPPGLEAIVMRLLAKDPGSRFATSAALIEALDALDLAPVSAPSPPVATPDAPIAAARAALPTVWWRGAGSRRVLMLALGAFALAFAAVGAYRYTEPDEAGDPVDAVTDASASATP